MSKDGSDLDLDLKVQMSLKIEKIPAVGKKYHILIIFIKKKNSTKKIG